MVATVMMTTMTAMTSLGMGRQGRGGVGAVAVAGARGTCRARLWGTRTARICIVPMNIVRPARILQMGVIVVTCCFGVGVHLEPAALGRARDARDSRTAPVVAFRTPSRTRQRTSFGRCRQCLADNSRVEVVVGARLCLSCSALVVASVSSVELCNAAKTKLTSCV